MAIKTFTTKSGKTVNVEFVRKVQDKVSYADGWNIVTGREIIEYQNITLLDGKKVIACGRGVDKLHPGIPTNAKMIARGAVARIGDAYIPQELVNQIESVLAELDAENPKSEEQLAIEHDKAVAKARMEAEEPKRRQHEEFSRKMERADSDY